MFRRLALHNFKNFRRAKIDLGSLTTFIGTNASGKSNVRDAFRFLNGVGLEYSLADIFGGAERGEGGGWQALRGGPGGAAYGETSEFTLSADFDVFFEGETKLIHFILTVNTGGSSSWNGSKKIAPPRVVREGLYLGGQHGHCVYDTRSDMPATKPHFELGIRLRDTDDKWNGQDVALGVDRPLIQQLTTSRESTDKVRRLALASLEALASVRFLDFDADAMRQPSVAGQRRLRDNGGNLAGVLHDLITGDALKDTSSSKKSSDRMKKSLISWLQELTPMDAKDIDFVRTEGGRISMILVEGDGRRTSAENASDGTLRFLGLLAALYSDELEQTFFIEEPDLGLHPTRIHLLTNLFEQRTEQTRVQVLMSTHSPQLLRMLGDESLKFVNLVYRPADRAATGARFIRIVDLPEARDILRSQDIAELFESGWFDDIAGLRDDSSNSDESSEQHSAA